MMPINTLSEKYLEKRTVVLAESGCWIWMLSTTKGGYGKASVGGKSELAHRAVWEARNGPIPEGLLLCHKCDTPSCVNPYHMFLGTHQHNALDMVSKGRSAKGEKSAKAKLSAGLVETIRQMRGPRKKIAEKMGVSETTIWLVQNNVTWRHVI